MTLYIGLMSGTSMDGIDAALIEMPSNTLIGGITKKYSADTAKRINNLMNGHALTLATLCELNVLIGKEFANAANELLQETKVSAKEIHAIGSHGQTVCHDTRGNIPYTLQLGCAHTISSLTGITVVADFRTRDLVNGGQGAPFAPLYHQELFAKPDTHVALVNIGGIANITFISPDQPTKGWDIGPGNCLMDAWIYKNQNKSFDVDGAWSNQGVVIKTLLCELLKDPFLKCEPPKSIGKEYFSLSWLGHYLKKEYRPVDVQTTLSVLTAECIVQAVLNQKNTIKQLYLCGGGTHNTYLYNAIQQLLPQVSVKSTAEININPDYLEAMMFAWLAAQTVNEIPVNLTEITGSRAPAILGAVYPILKSY